MSYRSKTFFLIKDPRLITIFFVGLVVIIFILASLNLFISSGKLIIWPDSIGYLHPAARYLDQGIFNHVNGRGFIYSAFLLSVLAVGDGTDLVLVQKSMLFLVYFIASSMSINVVKNFAKGNFFLQISFSIMLLLALSIFLFNGPVLALTYAAMPETLFLFLLTLLISFFYVLTYLKNSALTSSFCFVIFFIAFSLPIVKPHFLIAAVVVPITTIIMLPRGGKKFGAIALVVALIAALPFQLFEKHLQDKYDPYVSTVFGPMSLFCNNANIIFPYLAKASSFGFEFDVSNRLRRIVESGPQGGWNINKFDGDACAYGDIPNIVNQHFNGDSKKIRNFYLGSYFKASLKMPTEILIRLYDQFSALMLNPLRIGYNGYMVPCSVVGNHRNEFEVFQRLHEDCIFDQRDSVNFKDMPPHPWFTLIFLVSSGSGLVILIYPKYRKSISDPVRNFYFFSVAIFIFLNILIALVHTYDVDRYVIMQASVFFCMVISGLSVIYEFILFRALRR
jgi:hypothetical protein